MPDTSPKPKTREELEKEWFERWNCADFSWESLARKELEREGRFGEKTLQDYWRRVPGTGEPGKLRSDLELFQLGLLLRDTDERLWHIAHFDSRQTRDKEVLEKKAHFVWSEVQARLNEGSTLADHEMPDDLRAKRDLRPQFQGVVFPGINIDLRNAEKVTGARLRADLAWLGVFAANEQEFFDDFDISGSLFSGPCNVDRSEFRSSFIAEDAYFLASFLGDSVRVAGATNIAGSNFVGGLLVRNAQFLGEFRADGSRVHGDAHIISCVFKAASRWVEATFSGFAYFTNSQFQAPTYFVLSRFQGPVQMTLCTFAAHTSFESSQFYDVALFDYVHWPKSPKEFSRCFDGTVFHERANFERSVLSGFSAFSGVRFLRSALFDKQNEVALHFVCKFEISQIEAGLGRDFDQIIDARVAIGDRLRVLNMNRINPVDRNSSLASIREARLDHLERGCRVLKQEAGQTGDRTREQLFFRLELLTRNAQNSTPKLEQCVSIIYEASSSYGSSIWKPLFAFCLSIISFGVVFLWLSVHNPSTSLGPWSSLMYAMDLSLSRVLQPFGAISAANVVGNRLAESLMDLKDGVPTLTRTIAFAQSIVNFILFFLVGLALRRRFQIN